MDEVYIIEINSIVKNGVFDMKPIKEKDVDTFIDKLADEGFSLNTFFVDYKYYKLYTKDYKLAKHLNFLGTKYSIGADSIFIGEFKINKDTIRYITYSEDYIGIENESMFKKGVDEYFVEIIDENEYAKYKELTIDDIQNNYIENYALKEKYHSLNNDSSFIYHLIDLGFSVFTGRDIPELIIPKFKFYIEE